MNRASTVAGGNDWIGREGAEAGCGCISTADVSVCWHATDIVVGLRPSVGVVTLTTAVNVGDLNSITVVITGELIRREFGRLMLSFGLKTSLTESLTDISSSGVRAACTCRATLDSAPVAYDGHDSAIIIKKLLMLFLL